MINNLHEIVQEFRNASKLGISMRHRLILFLVVLVVTLVFGVLVIFWVTGYFTSGLSQSEMLVQSELAHITQDVSEQFGRLSVNAVDFSRGLTESIEKNLNRQGLDVTDLQNHPEVLEDLIENEYERILFSLQKTKSSGVFLILNTTVNADLEDAKNSRAGLFIKNMEPNIISSSAPTIVVLRGFPSIARKNSLPLHAQWAMEFDVSEAPYYQIPMEHATHQKLPLSRLFYWSPAITLPGTSEEVMLCSIPLIDSKGNVFGVCGFEVSAMLFKLANMPDNSSYNRIFCMLSPMTDNVLNTSEALFSGGYRALRTDLSNQSLRFEEGHKSFYTYRQENGSAFVGFHEPVKLYPKGSPFVDQKWAVALMIPQQDILSSVSQLNLRLLLLGMLLIVVGIVLSFFISKYYLKPIAKGLDLIKSNNFKDAPKTKIHEIDDLIQFLSIDSKKSPPKPAAELPSIVFDEFIKNTKTLSPAERAVFDFYVQGYTAKEITEILCLSINTIKTHNKRIYMKLNVSSRENILDYVNILKEMGRELK